MNRTQKFAPELFGLIVSYSLEMRDVPFNLLDIIKSDLNNGIDNIVPNGTVLRSGIEVLVFQPNCKWHVC